MSSRPATELESRGSRPDTRLEPTTKPESGMNAAGRKNSLNFIRIVLAVAVILSHAVELGYYGTWEQVNRTTLGSVAVYGFFSISGYLIAGSALRNGPFRFFWQRFLRIFPAFWLCLVVTAFGFGIIAWLSNPHPSEHLSSYFTARQAPFGYVYRNLFLKIYQPSIAGTPVGSVQPLVWNGSLWTLFYEFLCYLVLMGLAAVGLLKRRFSVLVITGALIAAITLITFNSDLNGSFSVMHNFILMNLMRFSAIFLTGALLYLYRDRVPDSGWIALGSSGLFIAELWLPTHNQYPEFALTTSGLLSPLIAYPMIWLGYHLPFDGVGARNDYSYGLYIYAYPVQQLLAVWGVIRWGLPAYFGLAIAITIPLAMASWWAVEKHALKLKRWQFSPGRSPAVPLEVAQPSKGPSGGAPVERPLL